MYTQNKKKFYIVGSNPNDFFDMTIEGVETLLKSEIIIFSKTFHRGFRSFLKDNNKNFVFPEIHILIIKITLKIFFQKEKLM